MGQLSRDSTLAKIIPLFTFYIFFGTRPAQTRDIKKTNLTYHLVPRRFREMASPDAEQITGLLMQHHDTLVRYAISLLGSEQDARDVVQDASIHLVRKAADYDPDRPFVPWACRFTYYEVLKFREKNRRMPQLLDDDVLEILATEQADRMPDERREALSHCLAKLPSEDQNLLELKYHQELDASDLCEHSGMSRRSLFRHLQTLRETLYACIRREVTTA
ncbi:MAG: sigma-70 family RNA polymerase sigma factor [Verrucomicrobiota bacterium]